MDSLAQRTVGPRPYTSFFVSEPRPTAVLNRNALDPQTLLMGLKPVYTPPDRRPKTLPNEKSK
jgi:hypothetical protein